MGGAKAAWMEAQERGWVAPDKCVCADCVSDAHLKAVIEAAVTSEACDYCGNESDVEIAAPVEAIMPSVMGALTHYFAAPADAGVPYETAEGGFLVAPTDTADALMSLPLECDDDLFEDIVGAISNDAWVPAAEGHWVSEQENLRLLSAWKRFEEHIKHRQRYFFATAEPEPGPDIEPSRLMPALGAVISELDLIDGVPAATPVFRARSRSPADTWPMDSVHLGAPPSEKATAGRMNPPGISYLYLALEEQTAIAEIATGPPCSFAIARFTTARDLTVLSLTDLPAVPSMFDHEHLRDMELLIFLQNFVDVISRPVAKDGSEHVEYVPTQVVCEYFASVFRTAGRSFDGILYPSAVRLGGRNLVLFPQHGNDDDLFPQVAFEESREIIAADWATLNRLLS